MMHAARAACALLLVLLAACSPERDRSGELAPQRPVSHSYEETLRFARRIEETMRARRPAFLNAAFDYGEFDHRIAYGTSDPVALRAALFENQEWSRMEFGETVLELVGKDARIDLVGLIWNDRRPRAFYRIRYGSAVNYFEMMIGETPDGRLCVVDFFDHCDGDPFSIRVRRVATWPVSMADKALGRRGVGLGEALRTLRSLHDRGKYTEALSYWASLPEEIREEKVVMMRRLGVAEQVSDSARMEALGDLHRTYGGDGSVALALMGYFVEMKEYDSAMAAIDRIDSIVGMDPYLDYARSIVRYEASDYEAARECLRRYTASDSSDVDAYMLGMEIELAEWRFGEALELADLIRERFLPEFLPTDLVAFDAKLARYPFFETFLASPECVAWSDAKKLEDDGGKDATLSRR